MLQFFMCVFLVIFVHYVDLSNQNNNNNNNQKIETKLIAENGTTYTCPYQNDVVLTDGENVTVQMTHKNHIVHAYVTLPTGVKSDISKSASNPNEVYDSETEYKKIAKFHITSDSNGMWKLSTLTSPKTSPVQNVETEVVDNQTYFAFKCRYNIKVQKKNPKENPKEDVKGNDWIYYVIGGSVLAIIIVIQTIVILYILKTKKIRRIEQLALSNNSRSASDTARYSTMPGRKPSVKAKDEDAGSIYESLDVIQAQANDVPPPPPIETLPRPPKTDKISLLPDNSNQLSTPSTPIKPPVVDEDRLRSRPQLPLPGGKESTSPPFSAPSNGPVLHPRTESNTSVTMRAPIKPKPAFTTTQIPPSPDRAAPKMPRKPSAITQGPLSDELNNILKKRQTGNLPPKPFKPMDVPEPIPEVKPKPVSPTPQGLKPPTFSKPTTPITPAKHLPPPIAPKTLPIPPKPTTQPLVSPKPGVTKKWPPAGSQGSQPPPLPRPAVPMPQKPVPSIQRPPNALAPRPVPVLPADGPEEEPEYAEYAEYNDDDDEEWTYEPLPQYNIYSS